MTAHWLAILGRLGGWNYALLALLVLAEGPLATLAGASLAAAGVLNPWAVFGVAAASNMSADFLWYTLGRLSGAARLKWLLQRLHIQEAAVDALSEQIRAHGRAFLFMAKITLSFSIPASIAAGMARVRWTVVLSAFLPAELLWTGSLMLLGYFFGQAAREMQWGLKVAGIAGGVVFAVFVVRYVLAHAWRPGYKQML